MTTNPSEASLREMVKFSKLMRRLAQGPTKGRAAALLKATQDHTARMTKIRETTQPPEPEIDHFRLASCVHYHMDKAGVAKGNREYYLDRIKNEPHYARRAIRNPKIRDTYHAMANPK